MSRSWIDSHFSGVIPRMLRVRPWRGRVEGEEGDDWVFKVLCLFVTIRVSKHKMMYFWFFVHTYIHI